MSDFDKDTEKFVEWLKNRGVEISSKIKIADLRSQNQGRGIIATEPITPDEVLFRIPLTACLPSRCMNAFDNENLHSIPRLVETLRTKYELSDWTALIVGMMCASTSEEWKPYFDCLPTEFNTPMFWTEEETKELLEGSYLVNQIGREEADQEYEKLEKTVFQDVFFKDKKYDLSHANFHRCGSLVMSYAFDVPVEGEIKSGITEDSQQNDDEEVSNSEDSDEEFLEYGTDDAKVMIPLADTLNAHTTLNNAHLDMPEDIQASESSKEFRMVVTKPIAKGEQVYNTYGSLSTGELLRRYGYVQSPHASYEVVEYSDELLCAKISERLKINAKEVERRKTEMEKMTDEESPDCHYIMKGYEGDDKELNLASPGLALFLGSVTVAKNSKQEFKACLRAEEKGKLNDTALDILKLVIEARIQEYPSPSPMDAPVEGIYTDKRNMCEQLKKLELQVLHESLDSVNARLAKKLKRVEPAKKRKH